MFRQIKKVVPKPIKKTVKSGIQYARLKPKYSKETENKFTNTSSPKLIMIGTPNFGNLGDHAIAEAQKQFVTDYFPDNDYIELSLYHYKYGMKQLKRNISPRDIILISGGGFLGNLWMIAENMVRSVIDNFPDNKIIIMPQTIHFDERFNKDTELKLSQEVYNKHQNLTVFLRDHNSYLFMKENFSDDIILKESPDVVTYLEESNQKIERNGVLFCMRNDKEKLNHDEMLNDITGILKNKGIHIGYTDTVISDDVTEDNRNFYLQRKYDEFRSHELVITDRLHGMIFSLITGTPCIAFDNSTKKVSGVHEWIQECGYIEVIKENTTFESLDSLEETLNYLIQLKNIEYDNTLVIEAFMPLIEELNDIKNTDNK